MNTPETPPRADELVERLNLALGDFEIFDGVYKECHIDAKIIEDTIAHLRAAPTVQPDAPTTGKQTHPHAELIERLWHKRDMMLIDDWDVECVTEAIAALKGTQ